MSGLARLSGSWDLARRYGFTDVDGDRPDWDAYYREVIAQAA